ncbi:DUF3887 domain-containing protein [Geminocystis sp. NIES-3709]|uniref:DUF3887 domain-containing protein n=1 Tax=Geminocystis sp. NIES-3709 TaxID=1617448 RepID=UPI0005FCAB55|nr:DUF3887 domain-containing protein [Geminocystis sp. NIES-3709]BAQ65824.1 hypothetical protein GM3709_2589 [Geminocystis sp. NIES-3709]
MKISRFISVSCLSLFLGGIAYQSSSYAEKSDNQILISQANNQENSATLEAKGKKIIDLFFGEKFDSLSELFSPQLQKEISPDFIKQVWDNTQKRNGSFKNIEDTKIVFTPGSDLAVFTINFEKVTQDWIIIFNDDAEVIGVDIPTSLTIDEISQNFINSLGSGDYAKARIRLHPFLKERIFAEQLQTAWENFTRSKGEFKRITNTSVRNGSKSDDTDVVFLDVEFSQNKEQILIIFDSSKSIIGVDFIQ